MREGESRTRGGGESDDEDGSHIRSLLSSVLSGGRERPKHSFFRALFPFHSLSESGALDIVTPSSSRREEECAFVYHREPQKHKHGHSVFRFCLPPAAIDWFFDSSP